MSETDCRDEGDLRALMFLVLKLRAPQIPSSVQQCRELRWRFLQSAPWPCWMELILGRMRKRDLKKALLVPQATEAFRSDSELWVHLKSLGLLFFLKVRLNLICLEKAIEK